MFYQLWFDWKSWAMPVMVTVEPENGAIVIQVLCMTVAIVARKVNYADN